MRQRPICSDVSISLKRYWIGTDSADQQVVGHRERRRKLRIRYRMLETIRQYADEKLIESGESEEFRDRHLEYFLNLAETAEPHLIRL